MTVSSIISCDIISCRGRRITAINVKDLVSLLMVLLEAKCMHSEAKSKIWDPVLMVGSVGKLGAAVSWRSLPVGHHESSVLK